MPFHFVFFGWQRGVAMLDSALNDLPAVLKDKGGFETQVKVMKVFIGWCGFCFGGGERYSSILHTNQKLQPAIIKSPFYLH
jgi:hypothetical protein